MNVQALVNDLSMFADLGTAPPKAVEVDNSTVVRLTRDGQLITLTIDPKGNVREHSEEGERRHASFKALLASANWANLAKWADSQRTLLQERIADDTIPVVGMMMQQAKEGGQILVDETLASMTYDRMKPRNLVLLIDGPAGIGKTSLIRALSHSRAENFRRDQRPLILHVESRGRMLQNITDLMAFSLQTLRLAVTYDQIPVLVRHGLITLAIDGFDELGDPNGYDLAWAQVNELIVDARGQGCIILAGRETFIGRERMRKALTSVDETLDQLEAFTIRSISPNVARNWLNRKGWSYDLLYSSEANPLFELGSYALRPFFLSELAREGVPQQIRNGDIGDLLSFLISSMTVREAEKFGSDVNAATTPESRMEFITRFMEETARDLAENQSNSIPSETLAWIAEIAAEGIISVGVHGILKNRAGVLAFLKDDDRRGYKSIVHEQVYSYFLAKATVKSINSGEFPKFIRRNILSSEFFEAFSDVFRLLSSAESNTFISEALNGISNFGDQDRTKQNLAALIMAACCVFVPWQVPVLKDMSLDEVLLAETVSEIHLQGVSINQITANGADMRLVSFDDSCAIVSLICDHSTILHHSVAMPTVLSLPEKTIYDPGEISEWIVSHYDTSHLPTDLELRELLSDFGLFNLLSRVARYKPFWIKDGDEKGARRIIDDEHWPILKSLMEKHNLIVERTDVPASGRPAPFYHVKNRAALTEFEKPTDEIGRFFSDVFKASLDMRRAIQ